MDATALMALTGLTGAVDETAGCAVWQTFALAGWLALKTILCAFSPRPERAGLAAMADVGVPAEMAATVAIPLMLSMAWFPPATAVMVARGGMAARVAMAATAASPPIFFYSYHR